MLLDYKYRWVVCTPSKTGSTALEASFRGLGALKLSPRHRCDIDMGAPLKILIVRHPVERLVSMYHFLTTERTGKAYGSKCRSFAEFLDKLHEDYETDVQRGLDRPWRRGGYAYDHRLFTMRLHEYADLWKPTRVVRLEDGLDEVHRLVGSRHTVKHVWPSSDTNRGKRPGVDETIGDEDISFWVHEELGRWYD